MNIIFAGTPDFAAAHLKAILDNKCNVVAVFSQPDRPVGRGHKIVATPVKQVAEEYGIPVFQPETLKNNDEALKIYKDLKTDLVIVVAYGQLIPDDFLKVPTIGTINVHGSLLPRWRGAAPIQRSIWAGDENTGISIMKVEHKLDSGDVLSQKIIPIANDDTSETLYDKLADIGCELLCSTVNNINELFDKAVPQDESKVTYAQKLTKDEASLDFSLKAEELERYIRAYQPWPTATFTIDGITMKIFRASVVKESSKEAPGTIISATKSGLDISTGEGILRILEIQIPGKKRQKFSDVLNSKKDMFKVGYLIKK